MAKCIVCNEKYSLLDIREWKLAHEDFSTKPLVCPDCYDMLITNKSLEDQFEELMEMEDDSYGTV